jgi:hypothetical protein
MSSEIRPFSWGAVSLSETIVVDGVPHTTRKAIGELFEYADPQNAIDKIIGRNEFIETYSIPVILSGMTGQNYETKVYHPIGFLLIAMKSEQPIAQQMQVAIAAFVWHFAGPKSLAPADRLKVRRLKRDLLKDLANTHDAYVMRQLIGEINTCTQQLGEPREDLRFLGKDFKQIGLEGF